MELAARHRSSAGALNMRIFLAGATGAVGKHLVPLLREAGHVVVGTTRTPGKADHLRAQGVHPEILDALDRKATVRAVVAARPDAIVHQLTAIPANLNLRRFDREFALTNRLRTEGTDNLLAAARAAGVRRVVAQSFARWTYERAGGSVKTEEDPLDPEPPPAFRRTLMRFATWKRHFRPQKASKRSLCVLDGSTVQGRPLAAAPRSWTRFNGGNSRSLATAPGSGRPYTSPTRRPRRWRHSSAAPGIYNVADDEPAPVREWLPFLANATGAPPPRRVPSWLAGILIGRHGNVLMSENRGFSNRKAKSALDWRPRHASWRTGFIEGLG